MSPRSRRTQHACRLGCWGFTSLLVVALVSTSSARGDSNSDNDFFERKIRPVLVERCYQCHSEKSDGLKGGLRLDTRDAARKGGDSGPAVVPGKPEESLLIQALRYDGLEMPPDGKLSDSVIADFEKWIRDGAADPREGTSLPASNEIEWKEARKFWSFQKPQRHLPPVAQPSAWPAQPIDAFVLSRLNQTGLQPNPEADRRILLRRVTFDLIGVPPTREELDAFLNDSEPLAYERVVDRLLASPQYGERWARLWLDVARYGEDQAHIVGDDRSLCYPNAYLYRDWVVAAFNNDMNYSDFVREQLAADLIAPDDQSRHIALGFLGLGPKYYRRNSPEVMADEWEDRIDTISRGLLGLTVACARCHDHKYDPIPTHDYYALAGVFASVEMYNRPLSDKVELGKNGQAKDPKDSVHIVRDSNPQDIAVQIRGNVKNKGQVVARRFLQVLSTSEPPAFSHGSGRLDLADAIIDRDNPLTARVIVNRVWGQIFGRPLVATPSNFGKLGERPSHPELLDDLAARFVEAGWSIKWLHRELVLSATYRQSSAADDSKWDKDPANRLLSRMNRKRLSVESWRDALLAVAGRLDTRLGGPSIDPQDPEQRRRTLYSEVSRLKLNPLLATFDFPDPNAHSERRNETTTPLQKLFVLNSPFMVQQAESLAAAVQVTGKDDPAKLTALYEAVFGRSPTTEEISIGLEFLETSADDDSRWSQLCQVLLGSNEFLILD